MFGISEPAISGISDLVITWRATFVVTSSSLQKKDLVIWNNNSSVKQWLPFRKKVFLIICSTALKLNKLSILLLSITNYSCLFYLFILFIYLTLLMVLVVSYQKALSWSFFFKWEYFCLSEGNRPTIQSKVSLPIVVGWQALHQLTLIAQYKKPFLLAVDKTTHSILLNLGDPFLAWAFLPHWRRQQLPRVKNPCQ